MIKNSNIYNNYINIYKKELQKEFNFSSVMQIPKLEKIVINLGLGQKAISDKNIITEALNEIKLITGQQGVVTMAKNSIANFKLREGMPLGVKVTLRGQNMYDFLEKLINIVIPRVRDFRGLNKNAFDQFGNYNFGLKELLVFPEIEYDKVKFMKGCNITIVTSTKSKEEALALLKKIGMPLKK